MWRRTYLLLILVRLYFALSPSYLHPDENFQGPEIIAGEAQGTTRDSRRGLTSRRQDLSISKPPNLGMDFFSSNPKRVPTVANVWPANDYTHVDLGGRLKRNSISG